MYYKRKKTYTAGTPATYEIARNHLLANGSDALSDAELLSIILHSYGEPIDSYSVASSLLDAAGGSLAELSQYLPEEFKAVSGVGDAKAAILSSVMELSRRISSAPAREKAKITDPSSAASLFMEDMRYLRKEILKIALIDIKNGLIGIVDISMGSIRSAGFSPRDIFEEPIKRGAHGIILAHNHPSGDPTPSEADIKMTKQICAAGSILGIQVLDHLIIGDGSYISLKRREEI